MATTERGPDRRKEYRREDERLFHYAKEQVVGAALAWQVEKSKPFLDAEMQEAADQSLDAAVTHYLMAESRLTGAEPE